MMVVPAPMTTPPAGDYSIGLTVAILILAYMLYALFRSKS